MYNKDIYDELAYKFQYLSNLKPDSVKTKFNFTDVALSDKFVQKFSPSKYAFYMQFLRALTDPHILKNVIYETKLIKSKKDEEIQRRENITRLVRKLYALDVNELNGLSPKEYAEKKQQRAHEVNKNLQNLLQTAMKSQFDEDNTNEILKAFIPGYNPSNNQKGAEQKGGAPTDVDGIKTLIQDKKDAFEKQGIGKYIDAVDKILKNQDKTMSRNIKAQKLQDVMMEWEDDPQYSINKFKLTKEDKLVFIGVTFVIRLISLMIIDWSMTSNFIVNFFQAYMLYIGLYCLFLLLVMVIVNMSYVLSINDVFDGDHRFPSSLASIFYFFYIVPGKAKSSSLRILLHIGIIVLMTFIALFIVYNPQNNKASSINYDYSEKRNIKRQLNDFTLILWLFTSFLAMYYRP